ncbi:hypothetical protein OKW38_004690 [Paraburkholderia sp. MM5496-R1]|uniref:hypothetical protein n=1 Tax=Paraburkholderia sp. MM5496-R1 TaxID=2991065 RepID=UPI003D1A374F
MDDGQWKDAYLSVNWLEYLLCGADLSGKLAVLRQYQLDDPYDLRAPKPTRSNVYAVLPVSAIHEVLLEVFGATLECHHEPSANAAIDPHSGIHPRPGVNTWPLEPDAPEHLAVQQFLYQSISYREKGIQ